MHVFVATPAYGGCVHAQYVSSLLRVVQDGRMQVTPRLRSGESLITRARNALVAEFLSDERYTHLFWIDSDIGFDAAAFFRQVQSPHDVCGGVYPKKNRDGGFVVELLPGSVDVTSDMFAPVRYVGTGFMCCSPAAIERLTLAFPERYQTDQPEMRRFEPHFFTLFDTEVCEGRYLSEDYAFCKKCHDAGIDVMADVTSDLTHTGVFHYTGNWLESLNQ